MNAYNLHLTAVAPRSAWCQTSDMLQWLMDLKEPRDSAIHSQRSADGNVRLGASMTLEGPKRAAVRHAIELCEWMTDRFGFGVLRWDVARVTRLRAASRVFQVSEKELDQ